MEIKSNKNGEANKKTHQIDIDEAAFLLHLFPRFITNANKFIQISIRPSEIFSSFFMQYL